MWLQFDWGQGPRIGGIAGRGTNLFCAWLAWSRFRVFIPTWDRTLGTLVACVDATLRQIGGAPTYLLTDNETTVTVEHVAGVAVPPGDGGPQAGCLVCADRLGLYGLLDRPGKRPGSGGWGVRDGARVSADAVTCLPPEDGLPCRCSPVKAACTGRA